MFNVEYHEESSTVSLSGKFDASKTRETEDVLNDITTTVTVDMSNLKYICSAGIGILVKNLTRLKSEGHNLYLSNLNDHIDKLFRLSRLDTVFKIK
jgi:anti-sigma B factor antagonist